MPGLGKFIPGKAGFIPNAWFVSRNRLSSICPAAKRRANQKPKVKVTDMTQPAIRQPYTLAMGFGLWGCLVLLFATQFVLVGSFSWREAIVQALFFWGPWVLLMPAVVAFSFRFPFARGRLLANLAIHLVACTLVVVASQLAVRHEPDRGFAVRINETFNHQPSTPNFRVLLTSGLEVEC